MTTTTQALITVLIPGLLISIVTAVVTVKLSVRQFQSQKWWERKADAYSQIMEELTLLEFSYGAWYDDAISVRTLSDERRKILAEQHQKAEESVRRAAAAGSYIVSAETASVLSDLMKEFDRHVSGESWLDEIGRHYQSTKASIPKVRDYAKADLKQH